MSSHVSEHNWFESQVPNPGKCDFCGCKNKRLERVNKPHTYLKKLEDWCWLCKMCHNQYDQKRHGIVRGGKRRGEWNEKKTEFITTPVRHDSHCVVICVPKEFYSSDSGYHIEDLKGNIIKHSTWTFGPHSLRIRLIDVIPGRKVKICFGAFSSLVSTTPRLVQARQ